jgi:hypothetical protein
LAQKYTSHVIRGTLNWAKVLGAPLMNEYAKERQWSVDVSPDAAGMTELRRLKLSDKIKNKGDARGNFISFRQSEFKKNGELNDLITITDAQGNPWPANKKIGNGSVGDVKFSYTDFGTTKGNYIKAIRVLKHVPYVAQEFAPLSEDDEFFAGDDFEETPSEPQVGSDTPAAPSAEENLDEDVPF